MRFHLRIFWMVFLHFARHCAARAKYCFRRYVLNSPPLVYLKCAIAWLYVHSWYHTAKIHIAFSIYQSTPMYRERLKAFGHEWTAAQFAESESERKLFMWKITRRQKCSAFFLPYNHIKSDTFL